MIEKIKENWDKILLTLKEEHEISNISYSTWLEPLKPHSFKDNTVTIIVPEQTFLQYVNKKYGFLLKVTISKRNARWISKLRSKSWRRRNRLRPS